VIQTEAWGYIITDHTSLAWRASELSLSLSICWSTSELAWDNSSLPAVFSYPQDYTQKNQTTRELCKKPHHDSKIPPRGIPQKLSNLESKQSQVEEKTFVF
jgi:hypothetical protein